MFDTKIVRPFSVTGLNGENFSKAGLYAVLMIYRRDDRRLLFGISDDDKKLIWIHSDECQIIIT